MPAPTIPSNTETFDTLDELHDRLNAAVFFEKGYPVYNQHSYSQGSFFECAYGRRRVESDSKPCPFRIKACKGRDGLWRIEQSASSRLHCHPQHPKQRDDPWYCPGNNDRLRRVMKPIWDEMEIRAPKTSGPSRRLGRRSEGSGLRRSRPARTERSRSPVRQQAAVPQPASAEVPLDEEAEEEKPHVEKPCEVLVLSDTEDEDDQPARAPINSVTITEEPSLPIFLDSLSTTFKLSNHVELFRDPSIGVETTGQLLEVARTYLQELVDILRDRMGFGPAMASKEGLQKELGK